jgi:hypothetical protein
MIGLRGFAHAIASLLVMWIAVPAAAASTSHTGRAEAAHHRAAHRQLARHAKHGKQHRRATKRHVHTRPISKPTWSELPSPQPPFRHPPVPVDGPICVGWEISLPCLCPDAPTLAARRSPVIPTGDGWVDITLIYTPSSGLWSCPGGVSIMAGNGVSIAAVGYVTGVFDLSRPGIPTGAVTSFALPPGSWSATGDAGRGITDTVPFTVTAGLGTELTITLP